jgi:hypothetical protein
MNADNIKFRCSSLHDLLTKPKKKTEALSDTCKKHLIDIYVRETYHRVEEINNKVLTKGTTQEDESITLYCLNRKEHGLLIKNQKEFTNAYIRGTPDIIVTDEAGEPHTIIDIKSNWSANTFFANKLGGRINEQYKCQGLGYMNLVGCKKFILAYCLVNTPDNLIIRELEIESWKWPERDTPNWRELEIVQNHIFDKENFERFVGMRGCLPMDEESLEVYDGFVEIPMSERIYEQHFEYSAVDMALVVSRVIACRKYMNDKFFKSNNS